LEKKRERESECVREKDIYTERVVSGSVGFVACCFIMPLLRSVVAVVVIIIVCLFVLLLFLFVSLLFLLLLLLLLPD